MRPGAGMTAVDARKAIWSTRAVNVSPVGRRERNRVGERLRGPGQRQAPDGGNDGQAGFHKHLRSAPRFRSRRGRAGGRRGAAGRRRAPGRGFGSGRGSGAGALVGRGRGRRGWRRERLGRPERAALRERVGPQAVSPTRSARPGLPRCPGPAGEPSTCGRHGAARLGRRLAAASATRSPRAARGSGTLATTALAPRRTGDPPPRVSARIVPTPTATNAAATAAAGLVNPRSAQGHARFRPPAVPAACRFPESAAATPTVLELEPPLTHGPLEPSSRFGLRCCAAAAAAALARVRAGSRLASRSR